MLQCEACHFWQKIHGCLHVGSCSHHHHHHHHVLVSPDRVSCPRRVSRNLSAPGSLSQQTGEPQFMWISRGGSRSARWVSSPWAFLLCTPHAWWIIFHGLQEPVKRFSAFAGVGRTLSTAPAAAGSPPPAPAAAPTGGAAGSPPGSGLTVDESLPSTSIQLRLADGTRMVARFNNHHTVGDIRAFIDASRPTAERGYRLQTMGFPPAQLTDPAQTIEQAGLANSVVIQKL